MAHSGVVLTCRSRGGGVELGTNVPNRRDSQQVESAVATFNIPKSRYQHDASSWGWGRLPDESGGGFDACGCEARCGAGSSARLGRVGARDQEVWASAQVCPQERREKAGMNELPGDPLR